MNNGVVCGYNEIEGAIYVMHNDDHWDKVDRDDDRFALLCVTKQWMDYHEMFRSKEKRHDKPFAIAWTQSGPGTHTTPSPTQACLETLILFLPLSRPFYLEQAS